jgi:uncharacterized protein (TIGR00251 family)
MIDIRQDGDGVLLPVKVVPGASRTRLLGELGGRLKVAVASPPEGGQANKALVAFLADQLGTRKGDLTVEPGLHSPQKTVRIAQMTTAGVRSALGLDAD